MTLTKLEATKATAKIWHELAITGASKKPQYAMENYEFGCPCCTYAYPLSEEPYFKSGCQACLDHCSLIELWPNGCEHNNSPYEHWKYHSKHASIVAKENRKHYASIIADYAENLLSELTAKEQSKSTELKVGDFVKICDGSQAVRVDKFEKVTSIGRSKEPFEIIKIKDPDLDYLCYYKDKKAHNICIKSTKTGNIYLHTKDFVSKCDPPKKQVTYVKQASEIAKWLTDNNWIPDSDGWNNPNNHARHIYFNNEMWKYCGKELRADLHWQWHPDWLETKEV